MRGQGAEVRFQVSGFPDKSGFPLHSNRCQGAGVRGQVSGFKVQGLPAGGFRGSKAQRQRAIK